MEIERKFLLKNDSWKKIASKSIHIKQGYISTNPLSVVRIRIADSKSFLTIKGKGSNISRPEYEYEIPLQDAEEMYNLFCQHTGLAKTRHIVEYKGHIWEIDEFEGRHQGLILAEVEMKSEDEEVILPEWIEKEVTGDPRYYNSNLAKAD
ncbi:MAG: CYTH domain-containing protein [Candidatus Riflebacteria bacterium]|nr:CYTH domain-containing protein [Candidatus Riflebacteria bacterium]